MHEMSIAQNLLEIISQEMAKNGMTTLHTVKIKYGRMASVVPEALETAFMAVTIKTDLEGAVLELEEIPVTLECSDCGHEFTPDEDEILLHPCPQCGQDFGHTVKTGRELYIEYIEAE
ncbi:hydrogenase maturation nickel metallochaperone HypA [Desulfovibrio inopinatus]|uniref:hydrogenase maturation nickel metallochaperone HypA/HybF n=1 Tax=Desulfovibrio inopinatus TaxID=102109 RepID=UPI0003FE0AD9|nr:hydrogenase maturation nickel metallochaperone HypA [Desulfovibrio inopinatus]